MGRGYLVNKNITFTMKICGIYKITSPTNRVYIGQSIDINKRFKDYIGLKCKLQPKVYYSLVKYGAENHIFEIVEECSEEELNCRERFWQDEYDVLSGGLNCVLQDSKEKRKQYSEEHKKRKKENHPLALKVINTDTLEIFNSVVLAAESINMPSDNLGLQLRGKFRNKTNFMFYEEFLLGKEQTNQYPYKVIDKHTGIVYENVIKAAKTVPMSPSTLRSQLNGTYSNTSHFSYLTDYKNQTEKPVKERCNQLKVIDTQTGEIYKSIAEAAKVFNMNHHTLRDYLKGKCKNKTTLIFYNE